MPPRATQPVAPPASTGVPLVPSAAPPAADWTPLAAGVETRDLRVVLDANRPPATVLAVRFDPAAVRLRVGYAPGAPQPLSAWGAANPGALLVVNGGFFTPDQTATALVVTDGNASGASYEGFGGMLAVDAAGALSLRPLRDAPYAPEEPLREALQSFPMLVFPGGVPAELADDQARARRTAVALDQEGRLLLIVCPGSSFSLQELANWLATGELRAERALNLDGGSSTGMLLRAGAVRRTVDAFVPLPQVLYVEPKD